MREEPPDVEQGKYNAEQLVRYYKFYKQLINNLIEHKLDFYSVPIKTCYTEYGKYFDKLTFIVNKYGINANMYIKFCVIERSIHNPKELLNMDNVVAFVNDMKILERYEQIRKNYIKSAKFIAEKCIELNTTPSNFLRKIIIDRTIGYELICGNISSYFLASISSFDKIYFYLDSKTREEFSIIYNMREKLNQDVQEAFMKLENRTVSPIRLSCEIINKLDKTTK